MSDWNCQTEHCTLRIEFAIPFQDNQAGGAVIIRGYSSDNRGVGGSIYQL